MLIRNEARGYAGLGDPAVGLPVDDATTPEREVGWSADFASHHRWPEHGALANGGRRTGETDQTIAAMAEVQNGLEVELRA